MGLREAINGNPAVTGAAVALALIVAVFVVRGGGTTPFDQAYFYNLQSGELVALDSALVAPTQLPQGDTAVRAHVFSCTSCQGESFIGYLEQYTDEAKQLLADIVKPDVTDEQRRELNARIARGILIALPPQDGAEPAWQPMESPASPHIIMHAEQQCGSAKPVACMPGQ